PLPAPRGEGTCRTGVAVLRLRGEACEPIELGLRQLAIVGDDHEMVLHQAQHLHGEPQPLARIGVAGRRVPPTLDVIGLDLREDLFERLAAEQLLGARAARDRRLKLVVGHLLFFQMCVVSAKAGTHNHRPVFMGPGSPLRSGRDDGASRATQPSEDSGTATTRRLFAQRQLAPLSDATNSRPTARGMPSVDRPAAAAYMARRCFSETGGILVSYCTGAAAWAASAMVLTAERAISC